jgi:hypothetical protein
MKYLSCFTCQVDLLCGCVLMMLTMLNMCCVADHLVPFEQPAAKKKQRLDVDGSAAATGTDGGSTTIFCGNLPWSATEEQISELFADCGEVTGVRIGTSSPSARRQTC